MYRAYDIFEVMPDGSSVKRAAVSGLEFAKLALEELSKRTIIAMNVLPPIETHTKLSRR